MPTNKYLKRKVRARMAETGEKYTDALRKIVAERKPLPTEVLVDALQDRCHDDVKPAKDSQ
jgi:hypothetical protein